MRQEGQAGRAAEAGTGWTSWVPWIKYQLETCCSVDLQLSLGAFSCQYSSSCFPSTPTESLWLHCVVFNQQPPFTPFCIYWVRQQSGYMKSHYSISFSPTGEEVEYFRKVVETCHCREQWGRITLFYSTNFSL